MGCDIHCYCEIKKKGENEWRAVGRVFKNPYYNEKDVPTMTILDKCEYCWGEPFTFHPITSRNYNLFAVLANVRNGTWNKEVEPISEPKGLPKDVSVFVKKKAREYGSDGHSHSYLTLQELKNYNWKKKIKMKAYVSKEQKKEYEKKKTKPNTYSAWSSNGVVLEWEDNYYNQFAKYFVDDIIPQLKRLGKYGEIRIVFWFDN